MIIFHNEVKKTIPSYPEIIQRLRRFLNTKEPRLAYFFAKFAQEHQNTITYEELQQALLRGSIDRSTLGQWRQDYSEFIKQNLFPEWKNAMEAASKELQARYPDFLFDPNAPAIVQWAADRAAELITSITEQQRTVINLLIQRAAVIQDVSVDQLARVIRPTIGLTAPQATANFNYFEHVKKTLIEANPHMRPETAAKKARLAAQKYAEKQQKQRAMAIARTELCSAYNQGEYQAVKQAQNQGYMGETVKEWVSAGDERVCSSCKDLDGARIAMDDDWDSGSTWDKKTPPAHPHCRCILVYVEITPPSHRT